MSDYSAKLQQFVDSHKPVTVVWDFETVKSLAAKAGLEVRRHHDGKQWEVVAWGDLSNNPLRVKVTTRKGLWPFNLKVSEGWEYHPTEKERHYHRVLLEENGNGEVNWSPRIEGLTLTFKPFAGWGDGFGPAPYPGEMLIQAAGLEPVEIQLPERVVFLPIPKWVKIFWDPSGQCDVSGTTVFESEARVYLDELNREVEERLAGNTCYQVWYNNGSGFYEPEPNGHAVWASSPEDVLNEVPGTGFPDRVVTQHGWDPNQAASFIKARSTKTE